MIGILIAIVLAAVAYWICVALGLPAIVALIAAVLVLLAGVPGGGVGLRSPLGRRPRPEQTPPFRAPGPGPRRFPRAPCLDPHPPQPPRGAQPARGGSAPP